tara:strand:+ start:3178 stop:3783 length:606 start_codon:yes stop_codon:yes gene_type:complete
MGIFGKSKANILATAFYQYGLEDNNLDDLCIAEAGGSKKGVLRETDYSVEVENANNKKTIEKFDGYYFNYIVWLQGRMVWLSQTVTGNNLTNLFEDSELKDIDEKNAKKALASKWKKLINDPDAIFKDYGPSIIYYKNIDIARFYVSTKNKQSLQIRTMDFQFFIPPFVYEQYKIKDTRSVLLDRDDMRFLQLQIAEHNLK